MFDRIYLLAGVEDTNLMQIQSHFAGRLRISFDGLITSLSLGVYRICSYGN